MNSKWPKRKSRGKEAKPAAVPKTRKLICVFLGVERKQTALARAKNYTSLSAYICALIDRDCGKDRPQQPLARALAAQDF